MGKNTKAGQKKGMGRPTANWVKRTRIKKTSSKTRRAEDKKVIQEALNEEE